jgi:hypothetical protein
VPWGSVALALLLAVFGAAAFVLAWLHWTQALLGKEAAVRASQGQLTQGPCSRGGLCSGDRCFKSCHGAQVRQGCSHRLPAKRVSSITTVSSSLPPLGNRLHHCRPPHLPPGCAPAGEGLSRCGAAQSRPAIPTSPPPDTASPYLAPLLAPAPEASTHRPGPDPLPSGAYHSYIAYHCWRRTPGFRWSDIPQY